MNQNCLDPYFRPSSQQQLPVNSSGSDLVEMIHGNTTNALHADGPRPAVLPVHLGCSDPSVVSKGPNLIPKALLIPSLKYGVEFLSSQGR